MSSLRLVFMGTPDFSVPVLAEILAAGHEVVAVYSQPPRKAGRGMAEQPSPVHRFAEEHGLPVFTPVSLKDEAEQKIFAELEADAAVVVAYGLLLPKPVLEAPRLGCLNLHASLLPRWRGAAPIQRAIMAGDAETGVSIMRMEAGLDTGPVLLSRATPIGETETAGELHDRLAVLGAAAIVEALARLPALVPEVQDDARATHAAKIDKAEARIDWTRPAASVARHVLGLSPFPGAWCMAGDERLKLLSARAVAGDGAPGTVLDPATLTVACGSGAVEIMTLQRPGRRAMARTEALHGFSLPPRLG